MTHNEIKDTKTKRGSYLLRSGIIATIMMIGLFVLLFMAAREAREAARRMQCVPKQIACAFHNYHDQYKTFPSAYSTDAEGKPLHSWRVLMLPFIEREELYKEIRLDEPWDSEYNSQFHDKMPNWYYCPSRPAEEKEKGLTPYQMVIGPDTISNGPNCTKLSDVKRGASNTILFVEASVSVPWMKPEDLPQSALQNGIVSSRLRGNQAVMHTIGSPHYNWASIVAKKIPGANVAMIDTSCHFFTAKMTPEELLEKSRIREVPHDAVSNDGN